MQGRATRCFVGLRLPQGAQERIHVWTTGLRKAFGADLGAHLRWLQQEEWAIRFAELGPLSAHEADAVVLAMQRQAHDAALDTRQVTYALLSQASPTWKKPRSLWIGPQAQPQRRYLAHIGSEVQQWLRNGRELSSCVGGLLRTQPLSYHRGHNSSVNATKSKKQVRLDKKKSSHLTSASAITIAEWCGISHAPNLTSHPLRLAEMYNNSDGEVNVTVDHLEVLSVSENGGVPLCVSTISLKGVPSTPVHTDNILE